MRVRASACEQWVWQQQHLCLLSLGCHNPFNNKRFYLGLSTNKPRNNKRYLFCSGFHNRSIRPNRYRNCVWHKSIFVREMLWGDLRPGIRFQTKHQKFFSVSSRTMSWLLKFDHWTTFSEVTRSNPGKISCGLGFVSFPVPMNSVWSSLISIIRLWIMKCVAVN